MAVPLLAGFAVAGAPAAARAAYPGAKGKTKIAPDDEPASSPGPATGCG
jgi:hypothetical protein